MVWGRPPPVITGGRTKLLRLQAEFRKVDLNSGSLKNKNKNNNKTSKQKNTPQILNTELKLTLAGSLW